MMMIITSTRARVFLHFCVRRQKAGMVMHCYSHLLSFSFVAFVAVGPVPSCLCCHCAYARNVNK